MLFLPKRATYFVDSEDLLYKNGDVCEVIDKHIPDFIRRLSQICPGFQGFLQTQIV